MDASWVSYGVYAVLCVINAIVALIFALVLGNCWNKIQAIRNPANEKLDWWDENKKDYSLSGFAINAIWGFCAFLLTLTIPYLEPEITSRILGLG